MYIAQSPSLLTSDCESGPRVTCVCMIQCVILYDRMAVKRPPSTAKPATHRPKTERAFLPFMVYPVDQIECVKFSFHKHCLNKYKIAGI